MHAVPKQLDASGLGCPLPVLRAQKMLRSMQAGEVLELLSTDQISLKEVPLFCEQTGHTLVSSEEDADGLLRFLIRVRG